MSSVQQQCSCRRASTHVQRLLQQRMPQSAAMKNAVGPHNAFENPQLLRAASADLHCRRAAVHCKQLHAALSRSSKPERLLAKAEAMLSTLGKSTK
eukprot:4327-Heterococcus_DN1.PRE.1